jgi:6-phosphofructokinase 2
VRFITLSLHPAVDRVLEVERLEPGGLLDAKLRQFVPAGKGVNTARALKRLLGRGGRVCAFAWLGRDEAVFFGTELAKEGLGFAGCLRDAATRVCITVLERACGRETHWRESMAAPGPGEERALLRSLARLPARGRCVALCGSAPPGTRRGILAGLLRGLRHRAAILVADTSGPLLMEAGVAGLDGVKGNAGEVANWLGLERPLEITNATHLHALRAALSDHRASGAPRAVLVTLGSQGAVLATREGTWFAHPPALPSGQALSATGCGDAATAGWLWAFKDQCPPSETVRRAVACGTAKLFSFDPGAVDPKIARRFLAQTRVEQL